jgi:microcystin-dependent protein
MDPFLGEIRVFGFNFAPRGWAKCNGQLLYISQNTALFSLLGTNFGGNGQTTFGLPDFEGRGVVSAGQAITGTQYFVGDTSGTESVTLIQPEMPAHGHSLMGRNSAGDLQAPGPSRVPARAPNLYRSDTTGSLVAMAPEALAPAGSTFPHNNMPPALTVTFCIALNGIFPPRP